MHNRRQFVNRLTALSALSFAGPIPHSLAQISNLSAKDSSQQSLLVIFLDGGNDGINTVIPANDPLYRKFRKRCRVEASRAIAIDDGLFLHPALRSLADVWEHDRLAIVQGVGYPNHSRSHFVSTSVWHSGNLAASPEHGLGFLGQAMDQRQIASDAPLAYSMGTSDTPHLLRGRQTRTAAPPGIVLSEAQGVADLLRSQTPSSTDNLDARLVESQKHSAIQAIDELLRQRPFKDAQLPETPLGRQLGQVAWLVESHNPARVYFLKQAGYDTHSGQMPNHAELLHELSSAVSAFDSRMHQGGHDKRVTTMIFSEFGRRLQENQSEGTDHGKAGPVFLVGGSVIPGLHGSAPNLEQPDDGDLAVTTDFRSIYRAVLQELGDFDDPFVDVVSPIKLFRA